jgi:hypothetical protein
MSNCGHFSCGAMAVFVFRLGKGTEKGGGGIDRPAKHRPPTKKTLNILFHNHAGGAIMFICCLECIRNFDEIA